MKCNVSAQEVQVSPPSNAVDKLEEFFEQLPGNHPVVITVLWPDKPHEQEPDANGKLKWPETRSFNNATSAAMWAIKQNKLGYNVYFQANVADGPVMKPKTRKDGSTWEDEVKPSDEHIRIARMFYVDGDVRKDKGGNEIETVAQAKAHFRDLFAQLGNPPSFVVDTGNGLQAGFFLEEPIMLDGSRESIDHYGDYLRGLISELDTDEAVQDVSRILRCPFTVNWPSKVKRDKGRVPVLSSLDYMTPKTYSIDEFTPLAPEFRKGKAVSLERTHVEGGMDSLDALGLDIENRSDNELVWLIMYEPRREMDCTGEYEGFTTTVGMYPHEVEEMFKDNPKRLGMLQPGADRSPRVFAVTMGLAQRGVPPERIVALLTNPSWPISAHVLDQSDPVNYAWKQVEHALAKLPEPVASEPEPASASTRDDDRPAKVQLDDSTLLYLPEIEYLFPIEDDLAPPPILVEGLLMDGTVTVLGGAGGLGKSLIQLHVIVSVASGKAALHWSPPTETRNVLLLQAEDDRREKQHRLFAVCEEMGLDKDAQAALAKKIISIPYGANRALFEAVVDEETGVRSITETGYYTSIEKLIEQYKIGLLVLDPFVEMFTGPDENSNSDMKEVMIRIRSLAAKFNIPILIAHHARKGYAADGMEQDAFRGAGAIINTARTAVLVSQLGQQDADKILGPDEKRESHIVLSDAKANYFAKNGTTVLKKIVYRHPTAGDRAALRAMAPNDPLPKNAPVEALGDDREAVLNLLRERRGNGSHPFMAAKRAGKDTRLDWAIVNRLKKTMEQAKAIISILEKAGDIKIDEWKDAKREVKQVYILNKEPAGHGLVSDACIPF